MRILITGYYGFKNLGDELILTKIIQDIKALYPRAEIIVHSANKRFSQKTHIVEGFVDRFSPTETVEAVKECDCVIVGGGGLINEYYPIEPKDFFINFGIGIASYAIVPLLAKIYGKPVFYWCHGLGPLFSKEGKNFARWFYSLADVITLRDEDSFALLNAICPEAKNAYLDNDPVTALDTSQYIKSSDIELPKGRKKLGINVRPWFGTEGIINNLANALTKYLQEENNIIVVPIPFDLATDGAVLRNLIDKIPMQFVFDYKYETLETPGQVISIMRQLDIFLGTRLHSIIVSQLLGLPTLSISYDQKTDAFSSSRKIPSVSIQSFRIEDIVNSIKNVSNNIIQPLNSKEVSYRTPQRFRAFVMNSHLPGLTQDAILKSMTGERELHVMTRHIEGLTGELTELREKYNELSYHYSALMSETQNSKLWKLRSGLKTIRNIFFDKKRKD